MHEKADDPYLVESRGDLLISRAVPLVSHALGLIGVADVVEFVRTKDAAGSVPLYGREGRWKLYPVEYKVGKPKIDERDTVQLCAQAMCLEETFGTDIPQGFMYYGTPRRRTEVFFNDELRNKIIELAESMHRLYGAKHVPEAKKTASCKSCSLNNDCLPGVYKSVSGYVSSFIDSLSEENEI